MENEPRIRDPRPAQAATVAALTEACQRNGWLKSGGYPWQDDPFLEEYPYSFSETGSVEALSGFFRDGNWSLRQGIVYKDLAFINQVDGGDEWWTLKNAGDRGWLDFESISCGRIAERDPEEFANLIACMHVASPEQCEALEYTTEEDGGPTSRQVLVSRVMDISEEYMPYEVMDWCETAEDLRSYVENTLENTPGDIVDMLEELCNEKDVELAHTLAETIEKEMGDARAGKPSLAERAQNARSAAEQIGRQDGNLGQRTEEQR